MIAVKFTHVEYGYNPRTEDYFDDPHIEVEEHALLTFRELREAMTDYPLRSGFCAEYADGGILKTMELIDPKRAKYWRRAYVQG